MKFLIIIGAVIGSLAAAVPASAEWFLDAYTGTSFTQQADIKSTTPSLLDLKTTFHDVHFDGKFDTSALSYGGRIGYWLENQPWFGLAVNGVQFRPNVSRQSRTVETCIAGSCSAAPMQVDDIDLTVSVISFDIMFRAPGMGATEGNPKGTLQPYVGAGPALVIAKAKDSTNFGPPNGQSDTDYSVGATFAGGFTFMFFKHFGVFAEYRFTHANPEFTFEPAGFKTKVRTDLNTHHLLGGISLRF